MTRKIVAGMFISLDGVVEDPQLWHFPYFNDEMGAAVGGMLTDADTLLIGRVTYDSFAGAWPDREAAGGDDAGFAKQLGDMRKVVVSRQPLQLTWRNSELLQGDFVEAVTKLKEEPGGDSIPLQLLSSTVFETGVLHLVYGPDPNPPSGGYEEAVEAMPKDG